MIKGVIIRGSLLLLILGIAVSGCARYSGYEVEVSTHRDVGYESGAPYKVDGSTGLIRLKFD